MGRRGCGRWGTRTGLESELSLRVVCSVLSTALCAQGRNCVTPSLHGALLQRVRALCVAVNVDSHGSGGAHVQSRDTSMAGGGRGCAGLCRGPDSTACLPASNGLSLLPRTATRRAPLTCWARTSGLPTPLTPSGKLILKRFKREMVCALSSPLLACSSCRYPATGEYSAGARIAAPPPPHPHLAHSTKQNQST